jgi:hypothetical protein
MKLQQLGQRSGLKLAALYDVNEHLLQLLTAYSFYLTPRV